MLVDTMKEIGLI